jgi:hypothetical protein
MGKLSPENGHFHFRAIISSGEKMADWSLEIACV